MATERPDVAAFFAELHGSVFKPRGYSRLRHTFQRDEDGYALAFQFQGSDWNSAGSPWRFYLNAGIRFPDVPRCIPDRDFPTIHTWTRVGPGLSEWSEPHYEIVDGETKKLTGKIAAIVHDSEQYFMTNHRILRQKFAEKPVRFLGYLDEALMKR